MSYTASRLLAIAAAEIGYHEKASNAYLDDKTANSGSNNWTKYARDLAAAGYYNGNKNGYAWCDVFVDWCFYQLAGKDATKAQWLECQTGPYGAGCIFSSYYYRQAGRFSKTPVVGAQIFFGKLEKEEHTGIVEKFDDTYVYTIEGNSSDQVIRRTYRRDNSKIVGYGLPRFDAEEVAPTPTKSIEEIAQEVIDGKWGNGEERKAALIAAGYDYAAVQAMVNKLLSGTSETTPTPTVEDYVKGIDVSVWNGNINWANVKAAGYKFVIIRSSYRFATDTKFVQNITGALNVGLEVGVYHFSYALNEAQARQEAEYVVNLLAPYKNRVKMPVFFDFEYDTITKAAAAGVTLGKTEFNKHAIAFLNVIEKAGYTPGIYYNQDYYSRMVDKNKLGKYFIWFAKYSDNAPTQDFSLWQHSSTGKIAGQGETNFDLNKMKISAWNKLMTTTPMNNDEEDEDMTQEKFNEMMNTWLEQEAAKEPSAWSKKYRDWAESNKYIQGDEKGRKMYKKPLTREEAVTLFYRVMGGKD